jgi:hypothetical protein
VNDNHIIYTNRTTHNGRRGMRAVTSPGHNGTLLNCKHADCIEMRRVHGIRSKDEDEKEDEEETETK